MTRRSLLTGVLAALALAAPASAHAADCANAGLAPSAGNLPRVSAATLCLVNAERTRRGLVALKRDKQLDAAAERQSRDMVQRQYFAHESPEGRDSTDRIRATGYMTSATSWIVGENIAWGTGALATPKEVVEAWMASPGHRANVLERRYREIGLGVTPGNPMSRDGAGATYANTFGAVTGAKAARARAQRS